MWCCAEQGGDSTIDDVQALAVSALPDPTPTMPTATTFEVPSVTPATPATSEPPKHGSFTVMIPTMDFVSLGLELDTTSDTKPMITEVKPGAVRMFNELHPEQKIMPNDVILALDRATTAFEISEKMKPEFPEHMILKVSRPRVLQVQLLKSEEHLGMKLEYRDNSLGGVIKDVASSGLLAEWNAKHPDDAVSVGDRIIELNGMRVPCTEMVERIKASKMLEFTVLKYWDGPNLTDFMISFQHGIRRHKTETCHDFFIMASPAAPAPGKFKL